MAETIDFEKVNLKLLWAEPYVQSLLQIAERCPMWTVHEMVDSLIIMYKAELINTDQAKVILTRFMVSAQSARLQPSSWERIKSLVTYEGEKEEQPAEEIKQVVKEEAVNSTQCRDISKSKHGKISVHESANLIRKKRMKKEEPEPVTDLKVTHVSLVHDTVMAVRRLLLILTLKNLISFLSQVKLLRVTLRNPGYMAVIFLVIFLIYWLIGGDLYQSKNPFLTDRSLPLSNEAAGNLVDVKMATSTESGAFVPK